MRTRGQRMVYDRFMKYWLEIIVWMGIIFWMSSGTFSSANTSRIIEPLLRWFLPDISGEMLRALHGVIRKCAHVTEYFVLGILLFRALHQGGMFAGSVRSAVLSFGVVGLFALSDEFHQTFVQTRTASLIDVGFDAFGGLLAQGVCVLWHYLRRHRVHDAS